MELRPLGRTGVLVSQFCLGAMMFGAWGNPDHDESIRIIQRALGAGINFIDTADVYGAGESEQIVGKALAGGRREDVVLATKFHNPMGEGPNRRGNSRRWILRAAEDGRHVLQPAGRRLAVGPLAQGRRSASLLARRPTAGALRPGPPLQP